MEARLAADAATFRDLVFGFLREDPVLNSILLTTVDQLASGAVEGPAVLVSVHDGGDLAGVAVRTALRGLLLGGLPAAAAPLVADTLAGGVRAADGLPGVDGTDDAALAFAERWTALRGGTYEAGRRTRLHRLGRLVVPPAPGAPRQASYHDVALIARWTRDFETEVGLPATGTNEDWATRHVAAGLAWLWDDGGTTVSLVTRKATVAGASRIGPVYTPPALRGRGYAGALTAHVSRVVLDEGARACLYTDLANPTSNRLYAAIGYEPVADFTEYLLQP